MDLLSHPRVKRYTIPRYRRLDPRRITLSLTVTFAGFKVWNMTPSLFVDHNKPGIYARARHLERVRG